jgi:hypothetical protein
LQCHGECRLWQKKVQGLIVRGKACARINQVALGIGKSQYVKKLLANEVRSDGQKARGGDRRAKQGVINREKARELRQSNES